MDIRTVGELIDALAKYDRNLPVRYEATWQNVPRADGDTSVGSILMEESLSLTSEEPGAVVAIAIRGTAGAGPPLLAPTMRRALAAAMSPQNIKAVNDYYERYPAQADPDRREVEVGEATRGMEIANMPLSLG